MINKIGNLFISEEGQGMTEYGLILGVIATGILLALAALRMQVTQLIAKAIDIVSDSAASVLPTAP